MGGGRRSRHPRHDLVPGLTRLRRRGVYSGFTARSAGGVKLCRRRLSERIDRSSATIRTGRSCASGASARSGRKYWQVTPRHCSADGERRCFSAGSLARSSNGGVTWERLGSLRDHESPYGDVLALVDLAPAASVLAALARDDTIAVLSSGDFGETWHATGAIASPAAADADLVRFEALPGGSVLLWNGPTAFRSNDGGRTWSGTGEGTGCARSEAPAELDSVREQRAEVRCHAGRAR